MEKAAKVMKLIDTDVVIDYLRGLPPSIAFFRQLDIENTAISAVSEAELLAGKRNENPKIRRELTSFLGLFQCMAADHFIGVKAGDLKRDHGLALPDALIAATALETKATLYTRNIKHFGQVPALKIKKPY